NRYRMDDSLRRTKEMEKQQATVETLYDAFKMMNDSSRGIFSKDYGSWSGTLHTALYNPDKLQVGFAIGGDRLPFMIQFNDWLEGKQLNVKRINGKLDSKFPFAHMTKL